MIETIQDIEGGIRSACTYLNAKNIPELQANANWVEVN
jgi:hypothetical protein